MNRRIVKLVLLGFLGVSLLVPAKTRAQEKTAAEKVRIAIASSSLAFLVPFVAKDRGLYQKHGCEVELIQMRPNIRSEERRVGKECRL